jgi:hypothetical protein
VSGRGIPARARAVLYTDDPDRFPGYEPRAWRDGSTDIRPVAVVAVMRNEAASVSRWAGDLLQQTRRPDEVLVVDDGSHDGSADLLERALAPLGRAVRVLRPGRVGIAAGRNLAIGQAESEVVAVTDLGLGLEPDWLRRITDPFEHDPATQVVAGFYRAVDRQGRVVRRRLWPTLERVDPQTFLPASRSVAFTRVAWEAVGGYPEWLTLSGEDTWFALQLRERCPGWAFAPHAVVRWHAPEGAAAYWRKARYWASGDGESGLFASSYARSAAVAVAAAGGVGLGCLGAATRRPALAGLGAAAVGAAIAAVREPRPGPALAEVGAQVARTAGWLEGRMRRRVVQRRRAGQQQPTAQPR